MLSGYLLIMCSLMCIPETGGMVPPVSVNDSTRLDQSLRRDTVHLEIHGPSNDVAFYMNGLIFLSNSKYHRKMIPDHVNFGQAQTYFVPLEHLSLESSRPLFGNDPFPYTPGGMSFTRDYNIVYFTRNIELSGRRTVEKIYEMEMDGPGESEPQPLPFCSDPARYMHPAVSGDGSVMVFASDRMPSSGGLDLFLTEKTAGGWSTPVNMGRKINTSGHEWFPFLDHRKNLYFSSTGHGGFGGYDVFLCPFDGTGWGEPVNLSGFINSQKDEIAFSIHPNKKLAVYSTSFGSDRSQSQIYLISIKPGSGLTSGTESGEQEDLALLFAGLAEPGAATAFLAEREEQTAEPVTEPPADQARDTGETTLAEETAAREGPTPEKVPVAEKESGAGKESETKEERAPEQKPAVVEQEASDTDRVVFRVQVLSSMKPGTRPSLTIQGKEYDTFEYLYKGAYRITVGAFTDVDDALELRNVCRRSGYDQAFVAAFRNNERILDPSVFEK